MATFRKNIRKDGTVSYRAIVRLSGYPPKYATFPRMTDAKGWACTIENEMRSGRYKYEMLAQKRTAEELIEKYIDTVLKAKSNKLRYTSMQHAQLLWWKERIGKYALAHVTPAIIGECRDELLSGKHGKRKAPGTVNRYLAALSHVLTTAVREWGWLSQNPMAGVRRPAEPRGRVRFLTDRERELLLNACKKEKRVPLYLIVVLAISTGARKAELLGLQWKDVDMKRGCVTVHETKNGERRSLFLSGLALQLLNTYAKYRAKRSGYVFSSRNANQPMTIDLQWKRATARAGLSDFRFHDLRHTCASYLAMNEASIAEIAEVLGHKTLSMVKRYAHLSKTHTASVVASMNDKVFGVHQ
jgi:integrase